MAKQSYRQLNLPAHLYERLAARAAQHAQSIEEYLAAHLGDVAQPDPLAGYPVHSTDGEAAASEHQSNESELARALLNAPTDFIAIINRAGTILDLNDNMCRALGKPRERLLGQSLYPVFSSNPHIAGRRIIEDAFESGQPTRFEEHTSRGSFDAVVYPVVSDGVPVERVIVVARDISERVRIERLNERRSRIYQLLSEVSRSFVQLDFDSALAEAFQRVGTFAGSKADNLFLLQFADDATAIAVTHVWMPHRGMLPAGELGQEFPVADLSWLMQKMATGEPFLLKTSTLPAEAVFLREQLQGLGLRRTLQIPLKTGDTAMASLGFGSLQNDNGWSEEDIVLLRLLAEIVLIALKRERAERALRQSEERHRLISEMMFEYVYYARVDTTGSTFIEWTSGDFEALTNDNLPEGQPPSRGWVNLIHPDDWARLSHLMDEVLAGKSTAAEYRIKVGTGEWRWLRDSVRPIKDAAGVVTHICGAAQDITERKQAEAARDAANANMRSLLENATSAIWSVDRQRRLLIFNSTLRQALQRAWNIEPRAGLNIGERLPPAERQKWQAYYERAFKGEQFSVEEQYEVEGQQRYFEISISPIWDNQGEIQGATVFSHNITGRVEAEERRRNTEAKFRSLVESSSDGIFLLDTDGRIILWNQSCEDILGLRRREAINRHYWDIQRRLTPVEQRTADLTRRIRAVVEPTLQTGQMPDSYLTRETEVMLPDGRRRIVQTNSFLIKAAGGYMLGSIIRDVTIQRQAEQQRLELAVEKERVEMLQQFIADASHDLRNPINTIENAAFILGMLRDNPEELTRYTRQMQEQTERLRRLVEDMLRMSELDGDAGLVFTSLDLADLLQQITDALMSQAARHDQALYYLPDGSLPRIQGDVDYLHRALANLVQNALNYTPEGGRITVRSAFQKGQIVIEVEDNGIGIAAEHLPRIFERFYRVDKARSREKGGTGLGLAIARRVIELHGGHITVESVPGEGSTFRVFLPVEGA
jgi:PAS domain S-box-containing protein